MLKKTRLLVEGQRLLFLSTPSVPSRVLTLGKSAWRSLWIQSDGGRNSMNSFPFFVFFVFSEGV